MKYISNIFCLNVLIYIMKILINAFLIIIVVSLLLENINYKVSFGKKNDTNNKSIHSNINLDVSNTRDELLNYISTYKPFEKFDNPTNEQKDISSKKPDIKPGNYYVNNNNNPNFSSNISDLNKFYDTISPSEKSGTLLPNDYIKTDVKLSNLNSKLTNTNSVSNGYKSSATADSWTYSNELPMNGGQLGGIAGFDTLESSYALFGNSMSMESDMASVKEDDLRMGLGTPNTSNRNEGI